MKTMIPRPTKKRQNKADADVAGSPASSKAKLRVQLVVLECEECRKVLNNFAMELENLNLEWKTRDELLELSHSEQYRKSAFIISSELFLDSTFMDVFATENRRIYGTSVLNYCFKTNTILPKKPLQLYSMSMFGARLSLSGFEPDIRDREFRRIELMGGTVDRDFTTDSHILIANRSNKMSDKYKAAIYWRKPVCDIKVIDSMWSIKDKNILELVTLNNNPYSLPIFSGCTICLSNIPLNERTAMGQMIEENGGVYALDMVRGVCTHLVLNSAVGNKYKTAKMWGDIKIVTSRWLDKCLEKGSLLPEDLYYYDVVMKAQKKMTK